MQRKPEPEVMSDEEEVSAYASAAGQRHLDTLDNTFVEQVLSLVPLEGSPAGSLLDVGCGPGSIVLKIAQRCRHLSIVGLDYSQNMIETARRTAAEMGLDGRVFFQRGDAGRMPFADGSFDVVLSNSVLHHLADPTRMFREMVRVTRPGGAILVRDLRRPSRIAYPWHVRWHGRHYSGMMRKLFEDSVRAAYTPEELAGLLGGAGISKARIFLQGRSHMGFVYKGQGL
jgi:ubiquinone/menaquinone biosynthesis C-methylase UbiE